jgi:glutathione S-transferase
VSSATPAVEIRLSPLDLLRLARAELKRYGQFANSGAFEMFNSARLARELMLEAIDHMEQEQKRPLLALTHEPESES